MKKCQKCSKPATVHITEIEQHVPHEVHLCETHAQQYLSQGETAASPATAVAALSQYLAAGSVDAPGPKEKKKTCTVCRLTFADFRSQQRLGCPHDYDVFRDELLPLLETIHSETTHCGKVPKRAPKDSRRHAELIKLRHDLRRAVTEEDYEKAARLRDQIRESEESQSG